MDDRFGEWLRDAMADIDDGVLKRRWGGVESLAGSLEDTQVLDLLLYSTGCGTHNVETLQKVRTAFWEHDNAFRMEGNDLELRRLCGTVVIHVLHGDSEHKVDLALACVCLHFDGSHHDFGWTVLLEEAEKILQGLSADVRAGDVMERVTRRTIVPTKVLSRIKELIDEGHDQIPISDLNNILSQLGTRIEPDWQGLSGYPWCHVDIE